MFIKIKEIADLMEFVQHATQVSGDVIVEKGVFSVDGKSLLGMFSVDPTNGVTVIFPEDAIEFRNYLRKFEA